MIPKKEVESYRFTDEQKAIIKQVKQVMKFKTVLSQIPEAQGAVGALDQQHNALLEMLPTELKDSKGQ